MEKRKSFLINFAYYAVIFAAVYVLLKYAVPILMPFVIACVVVFLLKKPIQLLTNVFRLPWKISAILTVLVFYGIVAVLISMFGIRVIAGITALVGSVPQIYEEQILPVVNDIFSNMETILQDMDPDLLTALYDVSKQILQLMGQMVSSISVRTMALASDIVSSLPGTIINLVLLIISTFFIAIDYEKLTGFCMRQLNEKARTIFIQVKEYVVGTLWVCIRSYMIIMFITFVELSIGLKILGIDYAVLIALCISFFDILPVLGTGGIMLPWAAITLFQGNFTLALGLFLVYLIITVIRNIIEPKLVGSQLGLHPVVTLASMFAGVQFLGIVGLFGFPILLSLIRYLDRHGVTKVFK